MFKELKEKGILGYLTDKSVDNETAYNIAQKNIEQLQTRQIEIEAEKNQLDSLIYTYERFRKDYSDKENEKTIVKNEDGIPVIFSYKGEISLLDRLIDTLKTMKYRLVELEEKIKKALPIYERKKYNITLENTEEIRKFEKAKKMFSKIEKDKRILMKKKEKFKQQLNEEEEKIKKAEFKAQIARRDAELAREKRLTMMYLAPIFDDEIDDETKF